MRSFQSHFSCDGVYRENCKAGCQAYKQLALFLSPDGNISREESRDSTVPGDWDACALCLGLRGWRTRVQSLWCCQVPSGQNLVLSSESQQGRQSQQRETWILHLLDVKLQKTFLLWAGLWLLIIWTFWHAALIWRLYSFISKWNFTAPHAHFIWGTIYHPLFKRKCSLAPVSRHCLLKTVETRRAAVWTYPSHFHESTSNFVAFIQAHNYWASQMESRRSCCDMAGIKNKKRKVFKRLCHRLNLQIYLNIRHRYLHNCPGVLLAHLTRMWLFANSTLPSKKSMQWHRFLSRSQWKGVWYLQVKKLGSAAFWWFFSS